jgi:hypothetical protein
MAQTLAADAKTIQDVNDNAMEQRLRELRKRGSQIDKADQWQQDLRRIQAEIITLQQSQAAGLQKGHSHIINE